MNSVHVWYGRKVLNLFLRDENFLIVFNNKVPQTAFRPQIAKCYRGIESDSMLLHVSKLP